MGTHLLLSLYECPYELLDDLYFIVNLIKNAALECNATIIDVAYNKFEPHGVTAICLLAESHISIHTWPEAYKAACDIYTCGDADPTLGSDYIIKNLNPGSHSVTQILR